MVFQNINLEKELAERKKRNKAMRNFVKTEFPNAISSYYKTNTGNHSRVIGKFLRIVKRSDMEDTWGIKHFFPASWESIDKELVRLFEILNYGDNIEELERLIKELKSIIKQGKVHGTASVNLTDINIWYGEVVIEEPKWWFAVLENTFFGK